MSVKKREMSNRSLECVQCNIAIASNVKVGALGLRHHIIFYWKSSINDFVFFSAHSYVIFFAVVEWLFILATLYKVASDSLYDLNSKRKIV